MPLRLPPTIAQHAILRFRTRASGGSVFIDSEVLILEIQKLWFFGEFFSHDRCSGTEKRVCDDWILVCCSNEIVTIYPND